MFGQRRGIAAALVVGALVVVGLALTPATALACGGFFCFTQPIDQSAERVLYVQDGDKITVHIQISYTGKDEEFSWVLPLLSEPTLGIGSDTIFQILEQETSPRFTLQWKNTPGCQGYSPCYMLDAAGGGGPTKGGSHENGVQVLDQGNVGPYDYAILKSGDAQALIDWLNKNKYVQPAESKPLIDSYVKGGYVFLALKLQKDATAGDIAPIVVTMDQTESCLPIRLTKIAARPDMPIVAWTLGSARAIPKNFLHVEINQGAIDWLNPGSNYKTVVSKAVDQASGHAFTTEYAKKTDDFQRKFSRPAWTTGKNSVGELAKQKTPTDFMQMLLQGDYPRTAQMQDLLRKHVPKPAAFKDVTDRDFYNCIGSVSNNSKPCSDYKAAVAKQAFDAGKFADDVLKYLVQPLQDMDNAMKTHTYLTRLYTTIDPQEMDKDPIFAFNKDLPDVDNNRKAEATPICTSGSKQASKARIKLADGHEFTIDIPQNTDKCDFSYQGGSVGFGKGTGPLNSAGGQPAKKIEVLDESGPGVAIHPDDVDKVDAMLNDAKAGTPSLTDAEKKSLKKADWDYTDPDFKPGTGSSGGGASSGGSSSGGSSSGGSSSGGSSSGGTTKASSGGGGCTAMSAPSSILPLALLGLLALALLLRRRHRRL